MGNLLHLLMLIWSDPQQTWGPRFGPINILSYTIFWVKTETLWGCNISKKPRRNHARTMSDMKQRHVDDCSPVDMEQWWLVKSLLIICESKIFLHLIKLGQILQLQTD